MPLVVIAVILALQTAPSLQAADKANECPAAGPPGSLPRTPSAERAATGAVPFRNAATELYALMATQVRSEIQLMESSESRWNDYMASTLRGISDELSRVESLERDLQADKAALRKQVRRPELDATEALIDAQIENARKLRIDLLAESRGAEVLSKPGREYRPSLGVLSKDYANFSASLDSLTARSRAAADSIGRCGQQPSPGPSAQLQKASK